MSGRGSVKKDPSARWMFVVDSRSTDGKRRQIRRRGFDTKKAAQDALNDVLADLRSGGWVEPSKQTVAAFLTEWLETIESTVRPSTHFSYGRYIRLHVVPRIGDVKLQSLDAGTLNSLYADLLREGHKTKAGGLAPRTVHYIHTILHRAFKDATKWGRLTRNPSDAADPPRQTAGNRNAAMRTWPAEVVGQFLKRSRDEGDRYQAAWELLATTGMRRGETLGLRWTDVDLELAVVSIVQTVILVDHVTQYGTPKTKAGARSVDLDPSTVAALLSHRKRQNEERLLLGTGWRNNDLVFCKVDGEPLNPDRFSREFTRRVTRFDLPKLSLHGLRHTWATVALKAGIHPKVVQERLGHATIGITLDTYSHVTAGMQADAAARIANLISGGPDRG